MKGDSKFFQRLARQRAIDLSHWRRNCAVLILMYERDAGEPGDSFKVAIGQLKSDLALELKDAEAEVSEMKRAQR